LVRTIRKTQPDRKKRMKIGKTWQNQRIPSPGSESVLSRIGKRNLPRNSAGNVQTVARMLRAANLGCISTRIIPLECMKTVHPAHIPRISMPVPSPPAPMKLRQRSLFIVMPTM
jgi:hypothetical protein